MKNWLFILLAAVCFPENLLATEPDERVARTRVSIVEDRWYINDKVLNPGTVAEGLLMNVRMVNAVFEDKQIGNPGSGLAPSVNTDQFIDHIPQYKKVGVNAFTISLQGGHPGYEGAINSAYDPEGGLRDDYMERVERVIKACDELGLVVILSCFYQRQSSLEGKEAIYRAIENTAEWLRQKAFGNVVLEIANEYKHGGFLKWKDGDWLRSEAAQIELIQKAKAKYPALYISTSGMGDGSYAVSLAEAVDFITIHFNNTPLEKYRARIDILKKYGKPLICNEDDKVGKVGADALLHAVKNGCGWGYMNIKTNQSYPFRFQGTDDDPEVYEMFRVVTHSDHITDNLSSNRLAVTIAYPTDGAIFDLGREIPVQVSAIYPDTTKKYEVVLHLNGNNVSNGRNKRFSITPDTAGIHILQAFLRDSEGNEWARSPQVDFLVRDQDAASPTYFPPPDSLGGWRELKDPAEIREKTGIDLNYLDKAYDFVKTTSKNGGLLVLYDGWLIYERYFGKGHRDAVPNLASCGKSFTSMAVGILMEQHPDLFPDGLEQKVMRKGYFPSSIFPLPDPAMKDIRLGELLAFTAGIRGNNPVYVYGEEKQIDPVGPDGWQALVDDYVIGKKDGFMGKTPFTTKSLWCKPGEGYSYATASIHLASIMLRHIAGMELEEFIDLHLARWLEWGRWGFGYRNHKEITHTPGGGGIALRATDMLRAGYLLLNGGRWHERQVVPADFVSHSSKRSPFNPHYPYSLQFSVNTDGNWPSLPRDAYWKSGSGGHCLYIIPSLKLVIWKLGGRDDQYSAENTGIPQPPLAEQVNSSWPNSSTVTTSQEATVRTLELIIEGFTKTGK